VLSFIDVPQPMLGIYDWPQSINCVLRTSGSARQDAHCVCEDRRDDAASSVGDRRSDQGATHADSVGRQSGVRVTRSGQPLALLVEAS
jgi:hypothetical protein